MTPSHDMASAGTDWTPHYGSPQPVDDQVHVEVTLRDGSTAGDIAGVFEWDLSDDEPDTDIISWRPAQS